MSTIKRWQVTVSPGSFTCKELAQDQICTAVPVSHWTHSLIMGTSPEGDWIFVVPSDIQTPEEVERLLREAGITARVRLLAA